MKNTLNYQTEETVLINKWEWVTLVKKEVTSSVDKVFEIELTNSNEISVQEATVIQDMIIEENQQNGKHMLEKDVQEIMSEVTENWCCIAKIDGKIIWFITLMKEYLNSTVIYEVWSLIVDKNFRKKWIWKALRKHLQVTNSNKYLYSVTNQPAVVKINESLWNVKYFKDNLPEDLLAVIESVWALLPDDMVFVNPKLDSFIKN